MKKLKEMFRIPFYRNLFYLFAGPIIYFTGLHTVAIAGIQRVVLATGLISPDTKEKSSSTDALNYPDADYNLKMISKDGRQVTLEDLRGKTIFMNIWATWCPPCVAEMPEINDLYESLQKENVAFVMLSVDDDFEKAKKFSEKKGYALPIYTLNSNLPQIFSSQSIPTTFVISPTGKIVLRQEGMASYNTEKFKEFLRSLQ